MNLQHIAQTIVSESKVEYRDDNKPYMTINYDNHYWIENFVFKCHSGFLPDDYRFQWIVDISNHIIENDISETDDIVSFEVAESLVDVYTSDLTAWLHSNISRVTYLTEALEVTECSDGFELLTVAMLMEIQKVIDIYIIEAKKLEFKETKKIKEVSNE